MLVKKNVLIMHPTDNGACAFYRCHFIADILRSQLGGEVEPIVSPVEINDEYILAHTAAIIVYRPSTDEYEAMIGRYKRKRNKFKYRIFADYDDLMFDIDGKHTIPDYNPIHVDTRNIGEMMERVLSDIDGITVSTDFIKNCMEYRFGWKHVKVLPNAVPRSFFGYYEKGRLTEDLKRPKVLYAGSACHFKEGDLGDFEGPWVPWLIDAAKEDRIELHLFMMPDFLVEIEDKIILHEFVSSVEFPAKIASIRPDFYIAPLRENEFNKAKSNLKLLEATAIGSVLIASQFMMSPYAEDAHFLSHVMKDESPESLDKLFRMLCRKEVYNNVMDYQYQKMNEKDYWMDSLPYIKRWLTTYFGNDIKANF